jgi:hypothetical protein
MGYGDCWCEFPECGNGRCVGSHFCPKHLKTPFRTRAEVNAYRRGQRDGRAEIIQAHAALKLSLNQTVTK